MDKNPGRSSAFLVVGQLKVRKVKLSYFKPSSHAVRWGGALVLALLSCQWRKGCRRPPLISDGAIQATHCGRQHHHPCLRTTSPSGSGVNPPLLGLKLIARTRASKRVLGRYESRRYWRHTIGLGLLHRTRIKEVRFAPMAIQAKRLFTVPPRPTHAPGFVHSHRQHRANRWTQAVLVMTRNLHRMIVSEGSLRQSRQAVQVLSRVVLSVQRRF